MRSLHRVAAWHTQMWVIPAFSPVWLAVFALPVYLGRLIGTVFFARACFVSVGCSQLVRMVRKGFPVGVQIVVMIVRQFEVDTGNSQIE